MAMTNANATVPAAMAPAVTLKRVLTCYARLYIESVVFELNEGDEAGRCLCAYRSRAMIRL